MKTSTSDFLAFVSGLMPLLSGQETKVLLHLGQHAMQSGQTSFAFSKQAMMDATGLNHKEVAESVKSLAAKELIAAVPQGKPGSDARIGLTFLNADEANIHKVINGVNGSIHSHPWDTLPVPDGFYVPSEQWQWLLRNVYQRKHTLLVGPTGCGKTQLVYKLAEATGRTICAINMGATTDVRSAFVGTTQLRNGETVFRDSRFLKALQDPLGIILLDEVNRGNPEGEDLLYSVLDGQSYLSLDEDDPPRKIAVHPNVVVFATANLGTGYSGTRPMDRAFQDRFNIEELCYPPKDIEQALLVRHKRITAHQAELLVKIAGECRELWRRDDIAGPVSTRMLMEAAHGVADGFSVQRALEPTVVNFFDDSEGAASDRVKVRQVIQRLCA